MAAADQHVCGGAFERLFVCIGQPMARHRHLPYSTDFDFSTPRNSRAHPRRRPLQADDEDRSRLPHARRASQEAGTDPPQHRRLPQPELDSGSTIVVTDARIVGNSGSRLFSERCC
jgi:hypothetical protein